MVPSVAGSASAPWAGAAAAATVRHPPAGADSGLQFVVVDGGTETARWWVSTEGSSPRGEVGHLPSAAVTVTFTTDDLAAVAEGRLSVAVGYMRGDVKVEGPTAPTLAFLAWTADPSFAAWRSALLDALADRR